MSRSHVHKEPPTRMEVAVTQAFASLTDYRAHGETQCKSEEKVRDGQSPCVWIARTTYARAGGRTPVEALLVIPETIAFEMRAAFGDLPTTVDLPALSQAETEVQCGVDQLQHRAAHAPETLTPQEWTALKRRLLREITRKRDLLTGFEQWQRQRAELLALAPQRAQRHA